MPILEVRQSQQVQVDNPRRQHPRAETCSPKSVESIDNLQGKEKLQWLLVILGESLPKRRKYNVQWAVI